MLAGRTRAGHASTTGEYSVGFGPLSAGRGPGAAILRRVAQRGPARRLTRDAVVYGIGGSAARLISVLFLPIFTRILTPEEYGALDLLLSTVALLTLVGMVGLNSAVFFHFNRIDDPVRRGRLTGTAIVVALAASVAIGAVGLAFARPLSSALLRNEDYATAVALSFVWLPLTVTASLAMDLLRLEFRPLAFSVVGIGRSLAANVLGVVLAVGAGLGVTGMIGAQVALSGAAMVIGLWITRATWTPALDLGVARRMVAFGLPLVPTGAAYWFMAYSDRFVIVQFRGLSDAGIYAMANKLAQMVQLMVFAFQSAWWPFAYAEAREPTHRLLFARVFRVVCLGLSVVALALGLFAREILIVVATPAFVPAYPYVGALAFALVINGVYQVVSIGVALAEQTWHMAWTSGLAAVTNVSLNLLLIPSFGIAGGATATLIAYFASAALLYRVAQRHYPIPYDLRTPALLAVGCAVALGGGLLLDRTLPGVTWSPLVSSAKAAMLVVLVVVALRVLRVSPRAIVLRAVGVRHGASMG